MPRIITDDHQHAHFVALSVEWCQLREEFHRQGTTKARKQEIRKRKEEIDAEQEEMLRLAREEELEDGVERNAG